MSEEEGEDEVNTKKTPVKAKENKKKKKVRIILTSSLFFNLTTFFSKAFFNLTTFFFQSLFFHFNFFSRAWMLDGGKYDLRSWDELDFETQ